MNQGRARAVLARLAAAVALAFVFLALLASTAERAFAFCFDSPPVRICTDPDNDLPQVLVNSPFSTLSISGFTSNVGKSPVGSPTLNPGMVGVESVFAVAADPFQQSWVCSASNAGPGDPYCAITPPSAGDPDGSCSISASAPPGTTCVSVGMLPGISGLEGVETTVLLDTSGFTMRNDTSAPGAYGVFGLAIGPNGASPTIGSGGNGRDGGDVLVVVNGSVTTEADDSLGIGAVSLAGNGGEAGVGGNGGQAGNGGTANVIFVGGSIRTGEDSIADRSAGIVAVSQGGTAGDGSVFLGGGGAGGEAGRAGFATVFTGAGTSIRTNGQYSHGIVAQSLGGSGGSVTGGFTLFGSGGSAGRGGNGNLAQVVSNSTIVTQGDYAQGILAQSIGGGGGDGGSVSGIAVIGANGGPGGFGEIAIVNNTGNITTFGFSSNAIEAQSIGGGGGNGGNSSGLLTLGGDGGTGASASDVYVTNTGTLMTAGTQASGILAQSIGGGGGNGGNASGNFAAGGTGGAGANSRSVTVVNSGNIETGFSDADENGLSTVVNSHGIAAQSVGGGGGNGGGAVATGSFFAAAFGGKGGSGGNGGAVEILLDDRDVDDATAYSIVTHGSNSHGVLAQSIGGGGGNGGFALAGSTGPISMSLGYGGTGGNGGNARSVKVETKGTIDTYGANSIGILAQGIGGGGGTGGVAGTMTLSGIGASMTLGGAGGGAGAPCGGPSQPPCVPNGGFVTVNSYSDITTRGDNANGIKAQSIGGGGGNGGTALSFTAAVVNAMQSTVGGGGGAAGDAGDVTVNQVGFVSTAGNNADAIVVQSIGGGGGSGGTANSGSVSVADVVKGTLGGSGAGGGDGGAVTVSVKAGDHAMPAVGLYGSGWNVSTRGANSTGILAQSIGGGGGNGGNVASYTFTAVAVDPGTEQIGSTTGGSGAGGGDGGTVIVKNGDAATLNASNIITQGLNSAGIKAQSIGGGGGSGGDALTTGAALAGGFKSATGGSGAGGGIGALSQVTSYGNVTTTGHFSTGIISQSIGGGGGEGGTAIAGLVSIGAAVTLTVGGSGGEGNFAGKASIDSTGNIVTKGALSIGLMAQSIGGGGGNGGNSVSASLALGAAVSVGIGGSGGGGSYADEAKVINKGNITTSGDGAAGIVAQSLGGGGGNGGWSVTAGAAIGFSGSVSVGGSGGGGSYGGTVIVNSTGDITTGYRGLTDPVQTGGNADGIRAQSIGGGGGSGGYGGNLSIGGGAAVGASIGGSGAGGGDGGSVNVTSKGAIETNFANSHGILAQSIGGGGGNGGLAAGASGSLFVSANLSVGGDGAGGGDGKTVLVTATGSLTTRGAGAHGILAQSIGGGGGNGGFAASAAGALTGGISVALGHGGAGAGGGSSGVVTVNSYFAQDANGVPSAPIGAGANVWAEGKGSSGIVAQSIGGGGGNGGFAATLAGTSTGIALAVSLGGAGGGGGSSEKVFVTSYNNITTLGDNGVGIMAQSIGGGGGNGGMALGVAGTSAGISGTVGIGGGGALGGAGDAVSVTSVGRITTHGVSAYGILAQSIGGGGGNGGFAASAALTMSGAAFGVNLGGTGGGGGDAGGVTVKAFALGTATLPQAPPAGEATIYTKGAFATGILAQSIGGGGGNGGFAAGFSAAGTGGALNANIGGLGGTAADAFKVTVISAHNIKTEGDFAYGISAQSIGGSGGNGGFAIGASVAGTGLAATANVGGNGGAGGNAQTVSVTNVGSISTGVHRDDDANNTGPDEITSGHNAVGILAQSIGGGGGNGGFAASASLAMTGIAANVGIGGTGAGGGTAEAVTVKAYASGTLTYTESLATDPDTGEIYTVTTAAVTNPAASAAGTWSLVTRGDYASGILAQSIGGGGGNGGFSVGLNLAGQGAAVGVTIGGRGGMGNTAGAVDVTSYHNVLTKGFQAYGIAGQSIGGGGGNGGFSAALSATTGMASAGVAIGGGGGVGSEASTVKVVSVGTIQTEGEQSHAILAQSIGGGGGNGGFAASGAITLNGAAVGASVGGDGRGGGDAAKVTVKAYAGGTETTPQAGPADVKTLVTLGNNASGIMAQSIGGSGGNGGFAASLTGATGASLNATVGGAGATGGLAGEVDVTAWHNIMTSGDQSNGITAQSLGGGGGNGGFVLGLGGSTGGIAASVGVGGSGSGGGIGGVVTVTSVGTITTLGDQSNGIVAQSIGGGGGNGGFSAGAGISLGGLAARVGVGGSGGAGATSDAVKVFAYAGGTSSAPQLGTAISIFTQGDQSSGIVAQSIGGGGGNGGFAASLSGSTSGMALGAAVGGSGTAGGFSGTVDVTSWNNIRTQGDQSHGIVAQSIGGGGGNGGWAASLSATTASSISASVGVGGSGAGGGKGEAVTVTSVGTIFTGKVVVAPNLSRTYDGNDSHGIVAQSIGGGGGNGGWSGSGAFSFGSSGASVSIGGSGGTGAAGGVVKVSAYAAGTPTAPQLGSDMTLGTLGTNSVGILAQSVGGGGGSGGMAVSLAGASGTAAIAVGVGGSGAAGGKADTVTVTSVHNIRTQGDFSHGIAAQSLGGGGGSGGAAITGSINFSGTVSASVGVGGSGDLGGKAEAVKVTQKGWIATFGQQAHGILAQSVGGGGGSGGFVASVAVALKGEAAAGAVAVGGSGAGAGNGETVTVEAVGEINTSGNLSNGILAQSIGGGGGDGGFAVAGAFSKNSPGVTVGVGGSGALGGTAALVTVTTSYLGSSTAPIAPPAGFFSIITLGDQSAGILAQSIGGGGGNGGFSAAATGAGDKGAVGVSVGGSGDGGGKAGAVKVESYHNIKTAGDSSFGIAAQSIGGGGGNGGFGGAFAGANHSSLAASVGLGGSGAVGGKGENVDLLAVGRVVTSGELSHAILAQSIGGGGGSGGMAFAGSLVLKKEGSSAVPIGVGLGGSGGGGGNGAAVTVEAFAQVNVNGQSSLPADGSITLMTAGSGASAILAQSIGGGGGTGGISAGFGVSNAKHALSLQIGGAGGTASDGGIVTVTSVHNILTRGDNASGVAAQSIGGGGGIGGSTYSFAGSSEGMALGMSFGGKAGAGGSSDKVTVSSLGTIHTGVKDPNNPDAEVNGDYSNGILAQSIGGGGGTGGVGYKGSFSMQTKTLGVGFGGTAGADGGHAADVVVFAAVNGRIGLDGSTRGDQPTDKAATIYTHGANANGILAQSIGGGGGAGGNTGGLSLAQGGKLGATFNFGGAAGGSGNFAGAVTVTSYHNITTEGDFSTGITAQSIGGGGGNGGSIIGLAAGGARLTGNLGFGGSGGTGGYAEAVSVKSVGLISTGLKVQVAGKNTPNDPSDDEFVTQGGLQSSAILAQSIGGGGGNGGFAVGAAMQFSTSDSGLAPSINIGGSGGSGGKSAGVEVVAYAHLNSDGLPELYQDVTVPYSLATLGNNSTAILAQSIAGGGGNGGFAGSFVGSASNAALGVAIGGSGGGGGSVEGDVRVTSYHNIYTEGERSGGIAAQSIGGGGGNGGAAISVAGTNGKMSAFSVAMGGSGGGGGNGGEVLVNAIGRIVTKGDESHGIQAQSIGGGGGNGGWSVAGAIGLERGAYSVSIGGSGGGGGASRDVTVKAYAGGTVLSPQQAADGTWTIVTLGNNSSGILAQSISGGGGNGGWSGGVSGADSQGAVSVAVGASGGDAGTCKSEEHPEISCKVTVDSWHNISTSGDGSHGIAAQSIGGGGGNGGYSIAAAIGFNPKLAASVGVGGSAGYGAAADAVLVRSVGTLSTAGKGSNGILAQSIGGGGGNGGFALTGAALLDTGTAAATVGVGGKGLGGGSGGAVTVNAYARLVDGVPAQRDSNAVSLLTQGDQSNGILAQSIGGGGGNGGWSGGLAAANHGSAAIGVEVGGTGAGGGAGGEVGVTSVHSIVTMGADANGILAQSLGGGGGNGGFAIALAGSNTGKAPAVGVGGSGEGGGAGGDVSVLSVGHIYTVGRTEVRDGVSTLIADRSNGILAQSIGGGGGNGGFAAAGAFSYDSGAASVSVGGKADGGGDGGDVTVSAAAEGKLTLLQAATGTTASIMTVGDNSSGILAQSIGGGGGNGGWAGTFSGAGGQGAIGVSVGGSGGAGGAGGLVVVTSLHNIVTRGDFADGITAQSLSGGGGNGGFAAAVTAGTSLKLAASVAVGGSGGSAAKAGDVTVTSTGIIVTAGTQSNGILAQAIGGGGGKGGFAVDGALVFSSPQGHSAAAAIGVGGSGGGGGDGGAVTVKAYAQVVNGVPQAPAAGVISLLTSGDDSNGILAQSIGGGGGNGGFSGGLAAGKVEKAGSLQVGGSAGTSSDGQTVTVVSYHNILTQGAGSNGIQAQSIGGGGGNGGVRVTLAAVNEGDGHAFSLGGGAGAGGDGGIVKVSAIGTIATEGEQSNGILAQSIGGGGGVAGESYKGSGVLKEKKGSIAVGGGSGGNGGIGNTVTVIASARGTPEQPLAPLGTAATLYTKGNMSAGIMAQSIGGGGGNAGMSGSFSYGGGGATTMAMKLAGQALGGQPGGGTGNFAGVVTVTSHHNIATEGDFSAAILAQSIGGGGGNGGSVIAASVTNNDKVFAALGIGGGGGSGGIAQDVTVKSVGLLVTEGLQSSGIIAQSIGGSGGNGGWVFSSILALGEGEQTLPKKAAVSIGGTGGGAGNSGIVTVNAYATLGPNGAPSLLADRGVSLVTQGNDSSGILAQSIGGGGGNGGFAASVGIGTSKAILGVAIGGGAGTAGNADQVKVTSFHNIVTLGARSNAIAAQSLGGGGGNGGVSIAVTGSGDSTAASVALGGDGAGGGNGAAVTVEAIGAIATLGADSNGILAQSIGGGGGNGGFALNGAIAFDGGAGGVSLGGTGGYGGLGKDVTVRAYVDGTIATPQSPNDTTATILTRGANANGILAQSIGGGGGNGGWAAGLTGAGDDAAVNVAVGGDAGNGATSGVVKVDSRHNIATFGDYANGIAAQSLAGGGGNGGLAISIAIGSDVKLAAAVAVGGSGGTGADAKTVTVQNVGILATNGDHSNGILAQSIGGGGGNGGFALTGSILFSDNASGAGTVGVGGSGTGGGIGNAVTVRAYAKLDNGNPALATGVATLVTKGDDSNGILAQSIGGGGGNGGWSGGFAGGSTSAALAVQIGGKAALGGKGEAVTVTSYHNIATAGDRANGILAQSIGGGGGNGGLSVALAGSTRGGTGTVSLGGGGGLGGDGGVVKVDTVGAIATRGSDANGILAQSIGGGGGNGGFALAGAFSFDDGGAAGVSIGGSGTAGGVGMDVRVRSSAAGTVAAPQQAASDATSISTQGVNAIGILAQSIGGGGGNGGWAGGLAAAGDNVAVNVAIGGSGGAGATAGKVTVDTQHNIVTTGAFSHGISAQSLAGGGGNGGLSVSVAAGVSLNLAAGVAIGGSGGSGANAEAVKVTNIGFVATLGAGAHGILAQSIGGGGGSGGFALSGALQLSDDPGGAANVGLGGSGAGGGTGNTVTVEAYARLDANGKPALRSDGAVSLMTKGADANGILAQSIGGGGGNGAWAGGLTAGTTDGAASVQLGGTASLGGAAGIVKVTSYHHVQTEGDRSSGIVAQSLGGGGGNGGLAVALTGSNAAMAASVAIGGAGGAGGNAAKVEVTSVGRLVTLGQQSNGILAQSIGGGGGNGGFAIAGTLTVGGAGASVSIGGTGGSAGEGGNVLVHSYAQGANGLPVLTAPARDQISVYTAGDDATGIVAQSIGGGGGNGGFAVAATGGISSSGSGGAGVAMGIGGNGGGGGSSGNVTVEAVHSIVTKGDRSYGILGQAIGGGGGNGAFAIGAAGGADFAAAVTVGGQGGTAGNGGRVTVGNTGYVTTEGELAYAILAQSVGGGGGNGGFAVAGALALDNAGIAVSLGGNGGGGGTASAVAVDSNLGVTLSDQVMTLVTKGGGAHAIVAQSIGGGGGTGGFSGAGVYTSSAAATIGVALGGNGGTGNTGGKVTVNSHDNILTLGAGASGILAQSVGGGGGDGGMALAGTIANPGLSGQAINLSAALGGSGGTGADAGKVFVTSTGAIYTTGQSAAGVVAQSIGGGGGNGGLSVAAAIGVCQGACDNAIPSLSASVGGSGVAGGKGNDVTLSRGGVIATLGDYSVGILAQSIGGGGGNGGLAIAGSIGGGAGREISAAIGGAGGAGSKSGDVIVTNSGAIVTGSRETVSVQVAGVGEVMQNSLTSTGRQSHGIFAQSIGGGGGNGGLAVAGAITFLEGGSQQAPWNINVAVGGEGGRGNRGGAVGVTNSGSIATYGIDAKGIFAQSIGGGGGNGGAAVAGLLTPGSAGAAMGLEATVAVGGSGGRGNRGGAVTVTQSGVIVTVGAGSDGIFAQSIGGGGGTGGNANAVSLQLGTQCTAGSGGAITGCQAAGSGSVNLQVTIGGDGGRGGHGGIVTVGNNGAIMVNGAGAVGIVAQSVGGGGGSGGNGVLGVEGLVPGLTAVTRGLLDVAGKLPIGSAAQLAGLGRVAVGGTGGAAGNGGAVVVTNASQIVTKGADGTGIEAQSVGGGGGKGGRGSAGIAGTLGIGGSGGASGLGGVVTVTNTSAGNIFTAGRSAHGIFAQSIGGGGGIGGAGGGAMALGGDGAASGGGGKVTIGNAGQILTEGDSAKGIVAQSVGGGGGAGGAVLVTTASIGGAGGASGDGGEVAITNSGVILTKGRDAHGIFAQSVGGGGGMADLSLSYLDIALTAGDLSVGGSGIGGGAGGKVTIANSGNIQTEGAVSRGIFAQSVGGGGGAGGLAGGLVALGGEAGSSGNGGEVLVTNGGIIVTKGADSAAIFAQSVGGGGGSAQGTRQGGEGVGAIALGGSGSAAGHGGAVTVSNTGDILTEGLGSFGIVAQSIGGGGGDGGGAAGVGLGGSTGSSGNGGEVKVTNSGSIQLRGDNAIAIFAQSVGGGGGYAVGQAGGDASIDSGATAGNGGNVTVINSGNIFIEGDNSIGILAQSVGGGGGLAIGGAAGSPAPEVVGATGDSGILTVNNTGSIMMTGDNNIAMMIQAIGGSGGVLQQGSGAAFSALALSADEGTGGLPFAGASTGGKGIAKTTIFNQVGNLVATGLNSVAVVGQSAAPDGKGDIVINLNNPSATVYSLIKGGAGNGAGIAILEGLNNVANNHALVTTILDIAGYAVRATSGNDQVNNFTWMIGQLALGSGDNGFTNKENALFDAGHVLDVGAGNLLKNEGLLSLGKLGNVFASQLTGNFEQTAKGAFALDFNFLGYVNDTLHVSGTTTAAGAIAINLLNPQAALPGTHTQLVVRSDGGVLSHEGLEIAAVDSAVASYQLLYPNLTDIVLSVTIDYSPDGEDFTSNQQAVGEAVNAIQSAGGTEAFDPIASALLYQPEGTLGSVYDSLSGEGVAGAMVALMDGNDLFMSTVMRQADFWRQRGADGQTAALRTDQLVQFASAMPGGFDLADATPVDREASGDSIRSWAGSFGAVYSYNGNAPHGTADLDYNTTGVAGGLEVDFGPDLFAGIAVGASWTDYSLSDRASSGSLTAISAAGYAVKEWGRFYASGLVGFSYGWGDEKRYAAIPQMVEGVPGFAEKLEGEVSTTSVMGRIEAGMRFDTGVLNVTPYAALQFDFLRMQGFEEQQQNGDASEIGLQYDDHSNVSLPFSVGLQLDGQWQTGAESSLAAWVRLEYVHELYERRDAEAAFIAAPGHSWEIDAVNATDSIKLSAGLDLAIGQNISLFVGGTGELGPTGYSLGGSGGLRLSW